MSGIEPMRSAPPGYYTEESTPQFSSDLASAVARAALRLEDEAANRRELSRSGRRRALEMRQRAIAEKRKAARSRLIAAVVGSSMKLAASAASTAGALASGGSASNGGTEGASATTSKGAAYAKGAATALENGGQLTAGFLEHRAERERLDGDSTLGGAEGLEAVAKEQRDRAEDAERSIERARGILDRIIDGDHARAMAALRG